jgi:4-hydroxy-tetrahydrodipicolinate synthase
MILLVSQDDGQHLYMLDVIPAGICGVMPGLAVSDLLAQVFQLATEGDMVGAHKIHEAVQPQIVFSLRHMELSTMPKSACW